MNSDDIRGQLAGGSRRSLGRANDVAESIARRPELFVPVLELLWDSDPVVRMRAADAAEKASMAKPELLQPHRKELLSLLEEATQQELRWHLALMIPRLRLAPREILRAFAALEQYLTDRSSIVKTCAMQALADLAMKAPALRPDVLEQLRVLTRTGTPAMRARGRMLVAGLEKATEGPDSVRPPRRAKRIPRV